MYVLGIRPLGRGFTDCTDKKLFNNSDLLMFSVNFCYTGKYKDTFWD